MKKYFIVIEEEELGPFSIDELKKRPISSSTLVWHDGMEDWDYAGNVKELKDDFKITPPVPKRSTSTSSATKKSTTSATGWSSYNDQTKTFVFMMIFILVLILGMVMESEAWKGGMSVSDYRSHSSLYGLGVIVQTMSLIPFCGILYYGFKVFGK